MERYSRDGKYHYRYVALNIYTGDLHWMWSNNYHKKGEVVKGEWDVRECSYYVKNIWWKMY